ncbi:MAG TPA: Fic family protein [Polyangia bacterium]
MIPYQKPDNWIAYDASAVSGALVEAKSTVLSLSTIPYQRAWVETLQKMELKREVAGTSKIEGAEFTDRELDAALNETPQQLLTRSQRQAFAAVQTYRWIAGLPDDRPVDSNLICEIHRRVVTGADDDHCAPGQIRQKDVNVNFGAPRHRGADGGSECAESFAAFTHALQTEYRRHDPIVQALAAHYHFAAMHPFLDGNGRTARALEALMLQRARLRDTCFIAMSNYYYDEKIEYLSALAQVRELRHDLTPFLIFGLKGIALQARRLLEEIQHQISKELFRNLMIDLFHRLQTPRKRVIGERQIEILKILLDSNGMDPNTLMSKVSPVYKSLKNSRTAIARDLDGLIQLKAIGFEKNPEGMYRLFIRLKWPTEITETTFFERLKKLPKGKTHTFL